MPEHEEHELEARQSQLFNEVTAANLSAMAPLVGTPFAADLPPNAPGVDRANAQRVAELNARVAASHRIRCGVVGPFPSGSVGGH